MRVVIVTCNITKSPDVEKNGLVKILRLPSWSLFSGRLPIYKPCKKTYELLEVLDSIQIDGILINTRFYTMSTLGVKYAYKRGIVPVVLDHGSDYLTFGNVPADIAVKIYEHVQTKFLRRYPVNFYGISALSSEWLKKFGINAKGVLCNGIDMKSFIQGRSRRDFRKELNIPEGEFVVVYAGRYIVGKGIKELVEASGLSTKDIHYVFAGEGKLSTLLSNKSNVHDLGRLPAEDLSALLMQADVFCLPSESEGFSIVLLEAAVCRCALVSTRVGIAPELISSNEFGVILKNAQPSEIANVISYLSDNRDLVQSMSENVYRRAIDSYTVEAAAEAVANACFSH